MITLDQAKGCLRNPKDDRDIVLGNIPFIPDPNAPSWEEGFNNEDKYGKIYREHQGTSLSCVGQAWSKYVEALRKKKSVFLDLSAKDIYSQIRLIGGGAYIRDGAKVATKSGICSEKLIPSYLPNPRTKDPWMGTNYPDECFMKQKTQTNATRLSAFESKCDLYVEIPNSHPLTNQDWENCRQVIWQFTGFIAGWSGHCVYAIGYGVKDGHRFIRFANSYGEGSDWYLWTGKTDYKYYNNKNYDMYNATFVFDIEGLTNDMLKIVGDLSDKKQYLLGKDGKLRWIFNETLLNELHESGVIDKNNVEWVDNLDESMVASPWAVIG